MKKYFKNFTGFINRNHLNIYMITIAFSIFFYALLKGATGHKFVISNEEKVYSLLSLLAFVLCGFYKERKKFGKKGSIIILYAFLPFSVVTFGMSLYFLYFTFTFDYGFNEGLIFILLVLFLLPIIFTWCNFYLIKNIIEELKTR